jgi:hypothetical protein
MTTITWSICDRPFGGVTIELLVELQELTIDPPITEPRANPDSSKNLRLENWFSLFGVSCIVTMLIYLHNINNDFALMVD